MSVIVAEPPSGLSTAPPETRRPDESSGNAAEISVILDHATPPTLVARALGSDKIHSKVDLDDTDPLSTVVNRPGLLSEVKNFLMV